MKQLPREQRRESILDAARDLLTESSSTAISMPEIATRIGVSRQILYLHFHGIDEVLDALYERTFEEYFRDANGAATGSAALGMARLERLLVVPVPVFRAIYAAFFAGPSSRPPLRVLQRKLFAVMEENWLTRLNDTDVDVDRVRTGIYALFGSALIFRDLLDRGLVERRAVLQQLRRMANATLGTSFEIASTAVAARPSADATR